MPDYRSQYYKLFRAMEKAISILIDAQCSAEEAIISEDEENIIVITEAMTQGIVSDDNELSL
ncbi:MAG: hypothetical protein E7434_05795 [Ruminococcaceae bacterium]|nr:hypothetical protein [Oscillospiraceae bacterium]